MFFYLFLMGWNFTFVVQSWSQCYCRWQGIWWLVGHSYWCLGYCSGRSGIWLRLTKLRALHDSHLPEGSHGICSCPEHRLCCLLAVQPFHLWSSCPTLRHSLGYTYVARMTWQFHCCRSWWYWSVSWSLSHSSHTIRSQPCRECGGSLIHSLSMMIGLKRSAQWRTAVAIGHLLAICCTWH